MSSREERSGRYQEPEPRSASGGHLAPDAGSGPLFGSLEDPLPSERERAESSRSGGESAERTEALTRASRPEARTSSESRPKESTSRQQQVRKRPGLRRVRRTVRRIDPFSVLKLSAFFYVIFIILWLVFVAVIYSVVDSMGIFDAAEDLGQALVLVEEVNVTLGMVEKWALLIGVVFGVLGTLINTLLAVLYNIGSDLLGGIELTFVERDQ